MAVLINWRVSQSLREVPPGFSGQLGAEESPVAPVELVRPTTETVHSQPMPRSSCVSCLVYERNQKEEGDREVEADAPQG